MVKCIIPARRDSRRIEGKNLLTIKGKNLIEIACERAFKSGVCDEIIVSTNIRENMNLKGGITDIRPEKIAKSFSTTDSLISYLIKKYSFEDVDTVILLQPTSPNRTSDDIKNAYTIFKKDGIPVVSVFEAKKVNDNLCTLSKKGYAEKLYINSPKIFQINGAIYIFSVRQFHAEKKIPQDSFIPFIMKETNSIDIDEYLDYIKATIVH
jgi:CMP-N-acetylneuraminic acid synthetase